MSRRVRSSARALASTQASLRPWSSRRRLPTAGGRPRAGPARRPPSARSYSALRALSPRASRPPRAVPVWRGPATRAIARSPASIAARQRLHAAATRAMPPRSRSSSGTKAIPPAAPPPPGAPGLAAARGRRGASETTPAASGHSVPRPACARASSEQPPRLGTATQLLPSGEPRRRPRSRCGR